MSDIQKVLDENIPRDVISTRSGGGKQLSYLETWYVIDRMNQVFGSDGWSNEIIKLELLPGTDKPSYMCIQRISVFRKIEDKDIFFRSVEKDGVGYGSDKSGLNPHEMAMKEAVSDAFKTAAKNLGRSMGLALYDKTQEYVDVEPKNEGNGKAPGKTAAPVEAKKDAGPSPKLLKQQIKSAFTVLEAQKKITKDDFVKNYLAGKKTDDLTDAEAGVILTKIKTNFKELGL